jgi:hypothetical protein
MELEPPTNLHKRDPADPKLETVVP